MSIGQEMKESIGQEMQESIGKRRGGYVDIQVGNIVKLKKKHPCGSFEWEVLRIGADFKLKCVGCGHLIMVPRKMVEKNLRGLR